MNENQNQMNGTEDEGGLPKQQRGVFGQYSSVCALLLERTAKLMPNEAHHQSLTATNPFLEPRAWQWKAI